MKKQFLFILLGAFVLFSNCFSMATLLNESGYIANIIIEKNLISITKFLDFHNYCDIESNDYVITGYKVGERDLLDCNIKLELGCLYIILFDKEKNDYAVKTIKEIVILRSLPQEDLFNLFNRF